MEELPGFFSAGREVSDGFVMRVHIAKLIIYGDLSRWKGDAGRIKAEREFGLDRHVLKTMAAYRAAGWKDA